MFLFLIREFGIGLKSLKYDFYEVFPAIKLKEL